MLLPASLLYSRRLRAVERINYYKRVGKYTIIFLFSTRNFNSKYKCSHDLHSARGGYAATRKDLAPAGEKAPANKYYMKNSLFRFTFGVSVSFEMRTNLSRLQPSAHHGSGGKQ